MIKVMCFGTFDILHPGHIYFLNEAKKLGDHLTVIVARDKTIEAVKKRAPKYAENERIEHIRDSNVPDDVRLGYEDDKYKIIEEINPDIIALGYDQTAFTDNLKENLEKRNLRPQIKRIDSFEPDKYKSSKFRD